MEQTYKTSPYYNKEDCIKKIIVLKEINPDMDLDDELEPEEYLNSLDSKIPPIC